MTRALERGLKQFQKNYILNGGMQVSQENGSAVGTTSGGYPVDQFLVSNADAGAITWAQVASLTPGGSPNRIRVAVTTADTSVGATDLLVIETRLEGSRTVDLRLGQSNAKKFTLQFGVKAPAGTYCVGLRNAAANRNFVAEYVIAAGEANTDVIKSIVFDGDMSGVWLADSNIGLMIDWSLMAGSNFQATPNAWGSNGTGLASSSQFNFMGTVGNVFELFDVGLYEGTAAPAFQLPDFASEIGICKRYWQKITVGLQNGSVVSGGAYGGLFNFPVAMRAVPTIALIANSIAGGGFPATAPAQAITTNYSTLAYKSATASGNGIWADDLSLNARL